MQFNDFKTALLRCHLFLRQHESSGRGRLQINVSGFFFDPHAANS